MRVRMNRAFNSLLWVGLAVCAGMAWGGVAAGQEDDASAVAEKPRVRLEYRHVASVGFFGEVDARGGQSGIAVGDDGYVYGASLGNGGSGLLWRKSAADAAAPLEQIVRWPSYVDENYFFTHGAPMRTAGGDILGLVSLGGRYHVYRLPKADPVGGFTLMQSSGLPNHNARHRNDSRVYHREVQTSGFVLLDPVLSPVDGKIYGVFGTTQPTNGHNERLFRIDPADGGAVVLHDFGTRLEELSLGHAYSINIDGQGRPVVILKAWEGERFEDSATVALMLRIEIDGATGKATASLLHRFTRTEVEQFSLLDNYFRNGYLVDGDDGWWYGNAGKLDDDYASNSLQDAGTGSVFRIRHDGSGFQTLYRFDVHGNTCTADARPFEPLKDYKTDPEYYENMPSTGPGSWPELLARLWREYHENDECYWYVPNGLMPVGPLVRTQDGIFGTTLAGGGAPLTLGDTRYAGTGVVFRILPEHVGHPDGGAYQLVRPFRYSATGEAWGGLGLVAGPQEQRGDGSHVSKLYGVSWRSVIAGASLARLVYSVDVAGVGIDLFPARDYWGDANRLIVGSPFTLQWEAISGAGVQLESCQGTAPTLQDGGEPEGNRWNGPLPLEGERTLHAALAGNHRLEIVCRNQEGTVYREASVVIPVYSPPVDEQGLLEPIRNGNGSFSVLLLSGLGVWLLYRRRGRSRHAPSAINLL